MLRRSAVKPVADHDWLVEGAADWRVRVDC